MWCFGRDSDSGGEFSSPLGCSVSQVLKVLQITPIFHDNSLVAEILHRPDFMHSLDHFRNSNRVCCHIVGDKVQVGMKEKWRMAWNCQILSWRVRTVRVCDDCYVTANKFIDSEQCLLHTLMKIASFSSDETLPSMCLLTNSTYHGEPKVYY